MKFDQLIESNTRKVFLEKSQIFEYLENEESFLDKIKKTFFIIFKGVSLKQIKQFLESLTFSNCSSNEMFYS